MAEVPEYIYACDVCLLPYKINRWTEHIDSLKLYEYLACGRPIVATDIPVVREYADVLRVAEDTDAFGREIGLALRETDGEMVSRRREVAARNTWDQRQQALSSAILNTVGENSSLRDARDGLHKPGRTFHDAPNADS